MNDELNRDARAFVVASRGAHEPAAGAKDRVRDGLIATLGLGPTAPVSSRAASSASASWITGGKLVGFLAVVSVGAGLLLARGHAKTAADVPSALVSAPVALHPRLPGPVTGPARTSASSPVATAGSVTPGESAGAPAASRAVEAPLVSVTDLPSVPPVAAPSLARQGSSPFPGLPAASPSLAVAAAAAAPEPGSLSAEVALLRRMSAALRGHDPRAALKAVAEHARRFPNGALAEEREVERIVALCALGRRDDAVRATDRFTRAYPTSSHGARIRAECAPAPDGAP